MGTKKEVMILGHKVDLVSWTTMYGTVIYNAYVIIKNSRYLRGEWLGNDVTYRKVDEMGVDTVCQTWLKDKPKKDKIKYCLDAIRKIIENCESALA